MVQQYDWMIELPGGVCQLACHSVGVAKAAYHTSCPFGMYCSLDWPEEVRVQGREEGIGWELSKNLGHVDLVTLWTIHGLLVEGERG